MNSHGGLRQRLTTVGAELSALAETPMSGVVGDSELTGALAVAQRVENIAHGIKLRIVAEIDARNAHRGEGAATAADLLAKTLGLTKGEARSQAEAAATLAELPETNAKLLAGELGASQAATVARVATEATRALATDDDADPKRAAAERAKALAELDGFVSRRVDAGPVDRTRLGRELAAHQHARGSQALEERQRRAHAARNLSIRLNPTGDGSYLVNGQLDALAGAQVSAAVDALARPDSAKDSRTYGQRCADALTHMAGRYLDEGGLPEVAAQRPHVIIVTTPEALHDQPGAEPSHLDGVGPIANATARQVCCDAHITDVIVRNGQILDVGRTRRSPSARQRAAVIARDKHCVGCAAPVARCEVHHIKWWRNNGPTDVDNLTLVCWNCHTHIHHHGWTVTRDEHGRYACGPPERPPDRPDPPGNGTGPPRHAHDPTPAPHRAMAATPHPGPSHQPTLPPTPARLFATSRAP